MKKLTMIVVTLLGLGACDTQLQNDEPAEKVAPLTSGDDGAEPSPAPDPRARPNVHWKCKDGDLICVDTTSLETIGDGFCEGRQKPECKAVAK